MLQKKEYNYTKSDAAKFINHFQCAPEVQEQELVESDEDYTDE